MQNEVYRRLRSRGIVIALPEDSDSVVSAVIVEVGMRMLGGFARYLVDEDIASFGVVSGRGCGRVSVAGVAGWLWEGMGGGGGITEGLYRFGEFTIAVTSHTKNTTQRTDNRHSHSSATTHSLQPAKLIPPPPRKNGQATRSRYPLLRLLFVPLLLLLLLHHALHQLHEHHIIDHIVRLHLLRIVSSICHGVHGGV